MILATAAAEVGPDWNSYQDRVRSIAGIDPVVTCLGHGEFDVDNGGYALATMSIPAERYVGLTVRQFGAYSLGIRESKYPNGDQRAKLARFGDATVEGRFSGPSVYVVDQCRMVKGGLRSHDSQGPIVFREASWTQMSLGDRKIVAKDDSHRPSMMRLVRIMETREQVRTAVETIGSIIVDEVLRKDFVNEFSQRLDGLGHLFATIENQHTP